MLLCNITYFFSIFDCLRLLARFVMPSFICLTIITDAIITNVTDSAKTIMSVSKDVIFFILIVNHKIKEINVNKITKYIKKRLEHFINISLTFGIRPGFDRDFLNRHNTLISNLLRIYKISNFPKFRRSSDG